LAPACSSLQRGGTALGRRAIIGFSCTCGRRREKGAVMRTAGSTAGLVALGAVLVGCGAAPSRSSATYTAANAVAAPAPATAATALPRTLHESAVGGVPYLPAGPGR